MAVYEQSTQIGPSRTVRPTSSMEMVSMPKENFRPIWGNQEVVPELTSKLPRVQSKMANCRPYQRIGISVPMSARARMRLPFLAGETAISAAKTSGMRIPIGSEYGSCMSSEISIQTTPPLKRMTTSSTSAMPAAMLTA